MKNYQKAEAAELYLYKPSPGSDRLPDNTGKLKKPAAAPARWRGLVGEYGPDDAILYVLEHDGRLCTLHKGAEFECLIETDQNSFRYVEESSRENQSVVFKRDSNDRATRITIRGEHLYRRQIEPESEAAQLRVKPVRPVPELIKEALSSNPPDEGVYYRRSNLVELTKLDRTIKLDIHYATTNNLFGAVFYSEARAFLQRPAAQALVRVNHKLKDRGYGLLVHDAYRPWYVTKVFWDATPQDKKIFVADPSQGSRHNRGAAVDLTLYDLESGKPVEMVGTVDETTNRSRPDYPGGTSLQRWHRDLLRNAMKADEFTVYELEWWHFDYIDWQTYAIGNQRFDEIE